MISSEAVAVVLRNPEAEEPVNSTDNREGHQGPNLISLDLLLARGNRRSQEKQNDSDGEGPEESGVVSSSSNQNDHEQLAEGGLPRPQQEGTSQLDLLPRVSSIQKKGAPVVFGDLWEDKPVIVTFFRRFGCGTCKYIAVEISKLYAQMAEAGIRLVGVCSEFVGYQQFRSIFFPFGNLLVDEKLELYKAMKLNLGTWRNLWGFSGQGCREASIRSVKLGYETDLKGNYSLMGGTFAISRAELCLFEHRQTPQDWDPNLDALMEVFDLKGPTALKAEEAPVDVLAP